MFPELNGIGKNTYSLHGGVTSLTQASYDRNQTQYIAFDESTMKTENGNNQPLVDVFQRQL